MRILEATPKKVSIAAQIVKRGGLVVYPTDTVYGLGCDPFNPKSVEKLIQVKGSREKPLPILSNTIKQIERVAQMSVEAKKLAEKFWPGPLTLVLPSKALPELVTSGLKSIGVRIPDNKIALLLVNLSGGLIIGTSANKTGYPPASDANDAVKQLGDQVDLILDGGASEAKTSSTVIELTCGEPRVLRKGSISLNEILMALKSNLTAI